MVDIPVSTGDIHKDYEIIGPVYFQLSNKPEGLGESTLSQYQEIYAEELEELARSAKEQAASGSNLAWSCAWGKWCLAQSNFDIAFFIAVEELKKRAAMIGADGVVFMRQDIDLNLEAYQFFNLQMYGTAVKFS